MNHWWPPQYRTLTKEIHNSYCMNNVTHWQLSQTSCIFPVPDWVSTKMIQSCDTQVSLTVLKWILRRPTGNLYHSQHVKYYFHTIFLPSHPPYAEWRIFIHAWRLSCTSSQDTTTYFIVYNIQYSITSYNEICSEPTAVTFLRIIPIRHTILQCLIVFDHSHGIINLILIQNKL